MHLSRRTGEVPIPIVPSFPFYFQIECYMYTEVHLHTSTLKMEAGCTTETSATSPTTARCNSPRTELISMISHCESRVSAIKFFVSLCRAILNKCDHFHTNITQSICYKLFSCAPVTDGNDLCLLLIDLCLNVWKMKLD
jgi:hypothetical protein